MEQTQKSRGRVTASYLAKIGMFTALASVLHMFIRFPLPFAFAPWLELHFSDLPALIGGFALGPIAGVTISTLRVLIKLLFQGTSSAYVGDAGDIIIGICLVLPASLIYKYNRTKKGALIALTVGSVCSVVASLFTNRFMLVPFFAQNMGFDRIVNLLSKLFSGVNRDNFYAYYIWLSVLPFNTLRCLLVSLTTFLVYKKISNLLIKF